MLAMRLLVTGAAGMLGTDVVAAAAGHDVVALARADLDITDNDAELNEATATWINGDGAGHVAGAAAEVGAHIVHVSTDYVFDGAATEPYREDAPTGPIGAYGRSKLAGELAVAALPDHAIVRTAWVFGPHGKNFVDTMLRLGAERDEVTVVDDQLGCPTYTGHLAAALVQVAEQRLRGVLHVAGGGQCTWWELAVATFEAAGYNVKVNRGKSADLGRPAPRPAYSVLGSTRSDAPCLPSWQEGLHAHLIAREVLAS